jgi:hypothetical protein
VLKATGDGLRVEPHRLTVLDPALAKQAPAKQAPAKQAPAKPGLPTPAGDLPLPADTFHLPGGAFPVSAFPVSAPGLPAAATVRVRWVDAGPAHLAAIASDPELPVVEVPLSDLARRGAG